MIGPEDLPRVNAALNGSCALLLILGFRFIRAGRITLHKFCMIGALIISVVFLASYSYYHIHVKSGNPTPFTGQGWVRPIYFAILISHTMLAVLVAPMALFTAYKGLRGQFLQHVKVARWTLPIWLYVSVTGVIVYWMLYHLFPGN